MSTSFPESILVTGGAGFVGSSLALHLKDRHSRTRIVCMDNLHRRGSELNVPRLKNAGTEFIKGDIRVANEFPAGPFEFILECSAEPSVLAGYGESPDYLMETNFLGTCRCLEQARQWKSKFLFLSTSRVYPMAILEKHPWVEQPTRFAWGDVPGAAISSRGVREDCPMTGARSLYGLTKFASEGLIEEYRAGFGLRAAINRCSVIAGPWQMGKVDQGVVALWVLRHFFGKSLKYLGYGGSGKQVRDVLHVADLCELVEEQMSGFDRWNGWLGNVGGGLEISVSLQELTAACREIVGREVPVGAEPENRQADLRIFLADCSRLFARTDWRPKRKVTEIVTDVFEWVRAHEKALHPLV
ncbi:MAG TPA: NAD-dependent epimerase/dehydratase family protein [Verrucomicrobiae bacterium]|nr:NAD-dependent epimerase/dehydratase family protein [Verrucomicrobiae bacterium]